LSRIVTAVLVVVLCLCAISAAWAQESAATKETPEQRDARMKWWHEAKFGMFIHWGIYSVPAGTWDGKQIPGIGEWIMHNARIPVADYAKLAEKFNPVKFNAEEWVKTARNAGMKYIVITSKHHDGFAMFHSEASKYNIYDATPFKRDPLKELAAACKKYGIRLGFYYSEAQDWGHPGGSAIGGHWDKAQDGSMDDYITKVAIPQVKEILSNYGKISVLWWDTPEGMTRERAAQLADLLKLQPGIVTNDRLGGGLPGDTATPEQWIPASGYPGRDWETCMTINDTWGYKSYDNNWKSTETLVRNLIDIASKGGNYLLNVGPTSEGVFPQPIVERLKQVGDWMKTNGEAIYGTKPSPFTKQLTWGRCTRKGSKLYLSVFDWPKDGKLRVPLTNETKGAYLLTQPKKPLKCAKVENAIEIAVPSAAPDKITSVVVLEIIGEPQSPAPAAIKAEPGKPVVLLADDAKIVGDTMQSEVSGGKSNLGWWTNPNDYVEWKVELCKGVKYEVVLDYALAPDSNGSKVRLECSGTTPNSTSTSKLEFTLTSTKAWDDYVQMKTGATFKSDPPCDTIRLKAIAKPGVGVMNLRSITLVPAEESK